MEPISTAPAAAAGLSQRARIVLGLKITAQPRNYARARTHLHPIGPTSDSIYSPSTDRVTHKPTLLTNEYALSRTHLSKD